MSESSGASGLRKCAPPHFAGTCENSTTVKVKVPESLVPIEDIEVRYTSAADPPTSGPKATTYWGGGKVEVESVKECLPLRARKALEPFSEHELTLSGLEPATIYTVRVRAKGSNGRCGHFSAAASFKTAEYLEPLEVAPATAVQSASDQDPSLLAAERSRLLEAVREDGLALANAPSELKANRDVVLAAVEECGAEKEHAADELKPPAHLLDLPTELLLRALSHCHSPLDIARVAAVSLLFHASLAEEAIRLWAQERGFELPALPEGECAVRWLCYSALLCEANPPARAAAGARHSLFIDDEGRLSSCGSAPSYNPGLLGHGEGVTRLNTPTRLPSTLGGERVVSVAAGDFHCLALTADGSVLSWGNVWSWGGGAYGQLGHGDEERQRQPKKVEALAGQRVVAVSAGREHSLALTADGALWSWGRGGHGRLGLFPASQQDELLPKKVEGDLAGQRVVAVSAGREHSLALTADGAAWSWGSGDFGQLGHGNFLDELVPTKVGSQRCATRRAEVYDKAFTEQRVIAVSAGGVHSLAITADGAVWSWGGGGWGQLGTKLPWANQTSWELPKKVEALAGQRVVAVSAGWQHSLARTADGAVWSWGSGDFGKLGHGRDHRPRHRPEKVEAFTGQRVVAVSAGGEHSLALTADGAVFTWGEGKHGCLGHGEVLSGQWLPKKVEAWAPGQ